MNIRTIFALAALWLTPSAVMAQSTGMLPSAPTAVGTQVGCAVIGTTNSTKGCTPAQIVGAGGGLTSTTTIGTGTGLQGGGLVSSNPTLSIANTAVSAGSYGSAANVPQLSVNAQGQITGATNFPIAIDGSAVTSGTLPAARLSGVSASAMTSTTGQAGSAARTLSAWQGDIYNVKNFGVGVGTGNEAIDTLAAQRAIAVAVANGGTVYFPGQAQHYLITPGSLVINITNTTPPSPRVRIAGDGPWSSFINCGASTGVCIDYVGGAGFSHESYFIVEDIGIGGTSEVTGSIGLRVNSAGFMVINNVYLTTFEYGLYATDLEISKITNSRIRFNKKGIYCTVGTATGCNSLALDSTTIGSNSDYGVWLNVGTAFLCSNCDIQYNGTGIGGTSSWGLRFTDFGGVNGISFNCVNGYFEGNAGAADVWIDQASSNPRSSSVLSGCEFLRLSATDHTTNNVLISGTQPATVSMVGSAFMSVSPYVPSAGEMAYASTNSAGIFYNVAGSSVFSSATNTPVYVTGKDLNVSGAGTFSSGYLSGGAFTITPGVGAAGVTLDNSFYSGGYGPIVVKTSGATSATFDVSHNLTVVGYTKELTTIVSSLPSAATAGAGAKATVTDALTPVFGSTVAGGGAVVTPVYSDGTNWKVG